MGADYYAKTLIGIKISGVKILKEVKHKRYNHDYSEDMNFDPKTGRELWSINYNTLDNKFFSERKIYGLDIGVEYYAQDPLNEEYYVGKFVEDFISLENLSSLANKVKKILGENGILLDNFGVHNYLSICC